MIPSDILTQQVSQALSNTIFNQIISLNTGIDNVILKRIVSRIAVQYAPILTNSVLKSTSFSLESIPKSLIGIKNPVNLVTNNISSSGLFNNLNSTVSTQVTGQVTNLIVSSLQNELRLILPRGNNLINFDNLSSVLLASITPIIGQNVNTVLKSATDTIFGYGKTIKPTLSTNEVAGAYTGGSTTQALSDIDSKYVQKNTDKYLQQSSSFDAYSVENKEKLIALEKGFIDPNANYPTKEYKDRVDVNKLATGDIANTIIQDKKNNKMVGARLPGNDSWSEPEPAYKAQYPYNKVTETESGHIIEIDDTPGSERLHVYHKSGTYIEIDPNGSVVKRTKGSSYEIIDKNGKISITGKADISVNGACNIFVGNDANIEVEGDTNLLCKNDITAQAGGKFNLSSVEEFNISSNLVNIQAYKIMNLKSNTQMNFHVLEDMHLFANTAVKLQTTTLHNKISGSSYHQATGSINLKAGNDINADGAQIWLNSNKASAATGSIIAGVSNTGIIDGRKDILEVNISDPEPLTIHDNYVLLNEDPNLTEEEKAANIEKLKLLGLATAEELNAKPVVQDTATVTSAQRNIIPGNAEIKNAKLLPGNFKLSPNFTVEMLSSKAAVTKDFIYSTEVSYGSIAYNLHVLALNVLEPVYNLYPNAYVTSGFRSRKNSSTMSVHPLGQAVDIQFKGASKKDYFDIAKLLAKSLAYDQFILEFCAYTNNPWIHISFAETNNRYEVMTFWNHTKFSSDLSQLA